MESMGAYEAKTHLSRLLDQVARGGSVTITRHGVPVAVLIPPGPAARSLDDVFSEIEEIRRGIDLDGITIRELIDEGRQ